MSKETLKFILEGLGFWACMAVILVGFAVLALLL